MIDESFQILSLHSINRPKFKNPMSRKAKRLLDGMLNWSQPYWKLWGSNANSFLNEFYPLFDPIQYEDVCHRFKVDAHLTTLKKPKADLFPHKTKQEVLDTMLLKHFNNYEWLKESGVEDNNKRVRVISTDHAREVYEWLTNHFLMVDFSEEDLNKIAMLGDEKFDLAAIKSEASKLDTDKRNVAYLYAIMRDAAVRTEKARQEAAQVQSVQDAKLQKIIQDALETKNKLVHQFDPDMRDEWERGREFIDILRDLKKTNE